MDSELCVPHIPRQRGVIDAADATETKKKVYIPRAKPQNLEKEGCSTRAPMASGRWYPLWRRRAA